MTPRKTDTTNCCGMTSRSSSSPLSSSSTATTSCVPSESLEPRQRHPLDSPCRLRPSTTAPSESSSSAAVDDDDRDCDSGGSSSSSSTTARAFQPRRRTSTSSRETSAPLFGVVALGAVFCLVLSAVTTCDAAYFGRLDADRFFFDDTEADGDSEYAGRDGSGSGHPGGPASPTPRAAATTSNSIAGGWPEHQDVTFETDTFHPARNNKLSDVVGPGMVLKHDEEEEDEEDEDEGEDEPGSGLPPPPRGDTFWTDLETPHHQHPKSTADERHNPEEKAEPASDRGNEHHELTDRLDVMGQGSGAGVGEDDDEDDRHKSADGVESSGRQEHNSISATNPGGGKTETKDDDLPANKEDVDADSLGASFHRDADHFDITDELNKLVGTGVAGNDVTGVEGTLSAAETAQPNFPATPAPNDNSTATTLPMTAEGAEGLVLDGDLGDGHSVRGAILGPEAGAETTTAHVPSTTTPTLATTASPAGENEDLVQENLTAARNAHAVDGPTTTTTTTTTGTSPGNETDSGTGDDDVVVAKTEAVDAGTTTTTPLHVVVPEGRSNFETIRVDEDGEGDAEPTTTTSAPATDGTTTVRVVPAVETTTAAVGRDGAGSLAKTTTPEPKDDDESDAAATSLVPVDVTVSHDVFPCADIPGKHRFSFTQSPSAFVEVQGRDEVKVTLKFVAGCEPSADEGEGDEGRPWTLDQFAGSWLFTDVDGRTCRVGSTAESLVRDDVCDFGNATEFGVETVYDEPSCRIESTLDVTDTGGNLAGSFRIRLSYRCQSTTPSGSGEVDGESPTVVLLSALDSPVSIAVRVYEKPNYAVQIGVMSAILLPLVLFVVWVTARRVADYVRARKGLLPVSTTEDGAAAAAVGNGRPVKNGTGGNDRPQKYVDDDDDVVGIEMTAAKTNGGPASPPSSNNNNDNYKDGDVEAGVGVTSGGGAGRPATEEAAAAARQPLLSLARSGGADVGDGWKYADDDDGDEEKNDGGRDVEKGC